MHPVAHLVLGGQAALDLGDVLATRSPRTGPSESTVRSAVAILLAGLAGERDADSARELLDVTLARRGFASTLVSAR